MRPAWKCTGRFVAQGAILYSQDAAHLHPVDPVANDVITPDEAVTLSGLFRERLRRSPGQVAYRHFDVGDKSWRETTWRAVGVEIGRWQAALEEEGLQAGDRVALMVSNSREWVVFDQAALGLGLVTVPLYLDDRPENIAYILHDAGVKLLLVEGRRQWRRLQEVGNQLDGLQRIVSLQRITDEDGSRDPRLESVDSWLFGLTGESKSIERDPGSLATIIYTSGTTGRPKGVMLSHRNILANAYAASQLVDLGPEDRFLSFLPLSHALERTAGYFLPMMTGAQVAFARSVNQLGEDLQSQQPTFLISVPRVYEKFYNRLQRKLSRQSGLAERLFRLTVNVGWARFEYEQERDPFRMRLLLWPLLRWLVADRILDRMGGRLRVAVCGGAALSPEVSRIFIGLGLDLIQGYGLTETSPLVSVNRLDDNKPSSVGVAAPGVEVKTGPKNELLTRSPSVMLGYWNNEEATRQVLEPDGWLHTGDRVNIDEDRHIYIIGRLKDIIVMANGEKVPPDDMENAITTDPLIDQVMVLGEGQSYLAALVVLDPEFKDKFIENLGCEPDEDDVLDDPCIKRAVQARVNQALHEFPGYAQIRRVTLMDEPWTVDDGLLTPTMKLRRQVLMKRFEQEIADMYKGQFR